MTMTKDDRLLVVGKRCHHHSTQKSLQEYETNARKDEMFTFFLMIMIIVGSVDYQRFLFARVVVVSRQAEL